MFSKYFYHLVNKTKAIILAVVLLFGIVPATNTAHAENKNITEEPEVITIKKSGRKLFTPAPVVQYGSVNNAVAIVQQKLIDLGYLNDIVDGSYGPKTQGAVEWFQQNNNIHETGVNKKTIQALGLDADELKANTEVAYQMPEPEVTDFIFASEAGRLYIPSLGISVQLVYADGYDDGNYLQSMVDSSDIALFYYSPNYVICDHRDQAFQNLYAVTPGTTAYIEYSNGSRQYMVCTGAGRGYNSGTDLINQYGESWLYWSYPLTMYTCAEDWNHVHISQWVYVKAP